MGSQKNAQITEANEKGQMLYVTLPNPFLVEMELRDWLRDTTVSINSVQRQISDFKPSDLSKFKALLDSKEITKSFFELVQKDRDCSFQLLFVTDRLVELFG